VVSKVGDSRDISAHKLIALLQSRPARPEASQRGLKSTPGDIEGGGGTPRVRRTPCLMGVSFEASLEIRVDGSDEIDDPF
jgi:hypothetical protein